MAAKGAPDDHLRGGRGGGRWGGGGRVQLKRVPGSGASALAGMYHVALQLGHSCRTTLLQHLTLTQLSQAL
jgi:hypothetical protein